MSNKKHGKTVILMVKNMMCNCCIRIIRQELEKLPVDILYIGLGEIKLSFDQEKVNLNVIETVLEKEGFPVIVDKEKILVEKIKTAIIEMIYFGNNKNSVIRNSDYLVEKLGASYYILTTIFFKHEGITLEKFIILHKVKKVKELLDFDESTLSEIAYEMGYSSVQYLSTIFKRITGISVTKYKKLSGRRRKGILINRVESEASKMNKYIIPRK